MIATHLPMAIERHHDVVEFPSRGNFIYITMERNLPPDANEAYAKGAC